jgi:hypothetical protein
MGAPRRSSSRLSQRRVALIQNAERVKQREEHNKREAQKRKRKPIEVSTVVVAVSFSLCQFLLLFLAHHP